MNLKKVNSEIRAYVRARIIDLKEKGYEVKKIGELLNVNADYVYQVLKKYRKNGNSLPTEKIRGRKFGKGRRLAQAESEEIRKAIAEHTPDYFKLPYSLWSREAIQELIKQKYGLEMPPTTITEYLNRWAMKRPNKMRRQ